MSGSEINVIDPSIVAISMPRVEIVSAIHLYPSGTTIGPVPRSDTESPLRQRQLTLTYTSTSRPTATPARALHLPDPGMNRAGKHHRGGQMRIGLHALGIGTGARPEVIRAVAT